MLWLALLALAAQQPAHPKWPIETLTVEGNRHYPAARVLAMAGLKVGQLAGKGDFEAARDRLVITGAFVTVNYRFVPGPSQAGYAASFQVVEVEPVYPVRFEELGVPDPELTAWLESREPLFSGSLPPTTQILERFAREIQEYLAQHRKEEKVAGRVIPTGPERFVVLFRPARPIPAVAQVTFTGNQVIPLKALQEGISGLAIGLPYTEARFRELLDTAVRPLYDARGRVRVAFPKVASAPVSDVQGLAVTVTVDEGASYSLGKVTLEGAAQFPRANLLKAGDFKTGDIANFDLVQQGVERIRQVLKRNGYLRVETAVDRKLDDAKKAVDVVVRITEGPQFTFGELSIEGLDLNAGAAIRKMWNLKPGKPFNAEYPDYFLGRVREDGLFDNLKKTRSAVKINEPDRTVNVTLFFNK